MLIFYLRGIFYNGMDLTIGVCLKNSLKNIFLHHKADLYPYDSASSSSEQSDEVKLLRHLIHLISRFLSGVNIIDKSERRGQWSSECR